MNAVPLGCGHTADAYRVLRWDAESAPGRHLTTVSVHATRESARWTTTLVTLEGDGSTSTRRLSENLQSAAVDQLEREVDRFGLWTRAATFTYNPQQPTVTRILVEGRRGQAYHALLLADGRTRDYSAGMKLMEAIVAVSGVSDVNLQR